MTRLIQIFFGLVVIAGITVGVGILYLNSEWSKPSKSVQEILTIPKGKGFSWVANELERQEIIPNATTFKLLQRLKYPNITIKAGEFNLSQSYSQQELIEKLERGDVIVYQTTLIDGWSFKQFKQHLTKEKRLAQTINSLTNKEILTKVGAAESHPEGLFAPETYFFQKGDSDLDILKRSYNKQQENLKEAWQAHQNSGNQKYISSPYEVLILASIIEKETGKESEREIISGVFYNRLKIGMKLQTDPTVIYGMGENFNGNIRRKDLRTDTPYNTYTRYGLPPTPIAMPGKASILAALQPKQTKALFFVGKGDGSHYFSESLKEHNRAVAKYQLGR